MIDAGETVAFLFDKSKNRNLMTNEQISKILTDNNTEMLISFSSPLKLKEGYEIALKSFNFNGTQAILELRKNGQSVDTKIIQSSIPGATMADKTYYYKKDLGDTSGIVTIAVHFKNIFHGDTNSATVDGIFQISDSPTYLNSSQQYGKMSIRNVNPTDMTILMDNKDNQIVLSKNKDVVLMQNIHIKTADQDTIDATTPLRYYIYSEGSSN
jgi:S-layer protein (TIGR01567 family)